MLKKIIKPIDFAKMTRRLKIFAIIAAILGITIGVLLIIAPLVSSLVLVWIIVGLTGLSALASVYYFIFPGKNKKRDGASLALAIVILILILGLVLCAVYAKPIKIDKIEVMSGFEVISRQMLLCFSIFFGLFTIVRCVYALIALGSSTIPHKGIYVFEAILSIIFGVCMIFFPFVMTIVGAIISGAYLIMASIGIIIVVCRNWKTLPVNTKPKDINNDELNK